MVCAQGVLCTKMLAFSVFCRYVYVYQCSHSTVLLTVFLYNFLFTILPNLLFRLEHQASLREKHVAGW